MNTTDAAWTQDLADFVLEGFTPQYGQRQAAFSSDNLWSRLQSLGTELWLDTGDAEAAGKIWTREFSALTTNNTLLNREIQKGSYDAFIRDADALLAQYPEMDDRQRMLEMAFMLNARHALKLVEQFDAHVSVELHTDLADDIEATVRFARRFYRICPERFIVKIPLTPAGLLATRRVAREGIPVNHTLGFSARQNVVITCIGQPLFVNVFLGRLNSFVADNRLGDGSFVGEKATLASQRALRALRQSRGAPTRQIGASLRSGEQVRDLAGLDVMTMPTQVAEAFQALAPPPDSLANRTQEDYPPGIDNTARDCHFDRLWEVDDGLRTCLEALDTEDLDAFSGEDLVAFFAQHGCGDLLMDWTPEQIQASRDEGKIPGLDRWGDDLEEGRIGLDSLLNLAGLNSFTVDQKAMDDHVRQVLA